MQKGLRINILVYLFKVESFGDHIKITKRYENRYTHTQLQALSHSSIHKYEYICM